MQQDDYLWRGHYDDGTIIDEVGPDGVSRPFSVIDLSRLVAFEVWNVENPARSYIVPTTEDRRVIFFRRRRIEMAADGGEAGRSTITCVGWQKTEHGKNIQSFVFLFADGSVVVTDDRNAV